VNAAGPVTRFAMDEDAARAWIAGGEHGLYIDGYTAASDEDGGSTTTELVDFALRAGIIRDAEQPPAGRPQLSVWHDAAADFGAENGIHWALALTTGDGSEQVVSGFVSYDSLAGGLEGAGLALHVLRQAAEAGNDLRAALADAARRITSRARS
jgi:hypothetical protein